MSRYEERTSRHEGVSCDSCLKGNFRGRRYKCLTCYDYDLCATCYEAGAVTTRHTNEHPMQCILTRSDIELFYGGEAIAGEHPQAFTCPFCGKMGFTELSLQEHVVSEHAEATGEVVCPVCATQPGGEPNLVTEDFAGHLALEHRTSSTRDLISFLDEPVGNGTPAVRRIPTSTRGGAVAVRARRSNMHFGSAGGVSSSAPNATRDSVDPITELLSQLSGVRRNNNGSPSAQLQHLQMQLHMERQQVRVARQQLQRLPRRITHGTTSASGVTGSTGTVTTTSSTSVTVNAGASSSGGQAATEVTSSTATISSTGSSGGIVASSGATASSHAFVLLLSRYTEESLSETQLQNLEIDRADRSMFMQEILLSMMSDGSDNTALVVPISTSATQQTTTSVRTSTTVSLRPKTQSVQSTVAAAPQTRVAHVVTASSHRPNAIKPVENNVSPEPRGKLVREIDNLNKSSEPPVTH